MKTAPHVTGDEKLVDRVRAALADVPGVREKRMFGSMAFMVRDKLCVSARAGRIMCRLDPSLHAAAVKREGCRTVVMSGRKYRGYLYIDADSVKTASALRYWLRLALNYNQAQAK